jgi:hypothetical protein
MMMDLVLNRTYHPDGTNGEILLFGSRICHSIELPWKDNKVRESCIPEGTYILRKRQSPKFGKHILVKDVPGRSYILLHPANDAKKELQGCIAPVTELGGNGIGYASRKAMNLIRDVVYTAIENGDTVRLIIQEKQTV